MPDTQQPGYDDLARMIEHAVLRPELSEEGVRRACELAREYRVAAVCVRPSDVDLAVRWMDGSGVALASVVSYPHGAATTPAKVYETRDLLRRGVKEIDTVLNLGKVISRQFQYVEMELQQMAQACHEAGAILKVSFESTYLTDDLKTIACRICRRAEVDYARASTLDEMPLMQRLCGERVKLAGPGVDTFAEILALRAAGCTRVSTIATASILDAWKSELKKAETVETLPAEQG